MKYLLLLVTLFAPIPGRAIEGFSYDPSQLSEGLRSAWDATFVIQPYHGGNYGSAFVIAKANTRSPEEVDLYLLTSDHVVSPNCGASTGPCSKVFLSGSSGFDANSRQEIRFSSPERKIINLQVFYRSSQKDLSIIKATVPRSAFELIHPIRLVGECETYVDDEVYVFGFPFTPDRLKASHVNISNPQSITRRWSHGYVVDFEYQGYFVSATAPMWLTTTADALPGSSGGPALSKEGDLIGIVDSVKEANGNTNSFVGDDFVEPRKSHSLLTRCLDISNFLTEAGFTFK